MADLYTLSPKELGIHLYRRFAVLLFKLMSRKGVVFIVSTILLCKGLLDGVTWFLTVGVILFNIGGESIAGIILKR